ncbi:MAG: hypothetical protein OEO83_16820 [Alphaproteobacteria bacterium]|nr:hypothetical protein [Alphaproteobacteria bacterium]
MAEAIHRVGYADAASVPLLETPACARLTREARALCYRPARPVVGSGETAVHQDFDLATEIPVGGLTALARVLDRHIRGALTSMNRNPLPDGFAINDLIVQRYAAGSAGITPHRDHIRYTGLVAIVVLAGAGRFFISQDRTGGDVREIPAPPGHLLLMRAPGFNGRNDRPFHAVRDITAERYIIGLRCDSRPDRSSVAPEDAPEVSPNTPCRPAGP